MKRANARRAAFAGLVIVAGLALADTKPATHPLEPYFGNTLVCAAAERGNDLCHTWLERDGTFINFDPSGMHKGRYTVGEKRPDGKVPFCYYYDSTKMVIPAEAMGAPLGPPPPASQQPAGSPAGQPAGPLPQRRGGVLCEIKNHVSTCKRYDSDEGLSEEQKKQLRWTGVERFHHGMCYPLPTDVKPGDSWWEDDDPLPGENGIDKMFLLKGHR